MTAAGIVFERHDQSAGLFPPEPTTLPPVNDPCTNAHGHAFQVVGINRRRFEGARRDTVYIPPMSMVTVALDAGEAASWMLHCHHMPHLATGMMTEFRIAA